MGKGREGSLCFEFLESQLGFPLDALADSVVRLVAPLERAGFGFETKVLGVLSGALARLSDDALGSVELDGQLVLCPLDGIRGAQSDDLLRLFFGEVSAGHNNAGSRWVEVDDFVLGDDRHRSASHSLGPESWGQHPSNKRRQHPVASSGVLVSLS